MPGLILSASTTIHEYWVSSILTSLVWHGRESIPRPPLLLTYTLPLSYWGDTHLRYTKGGLWSSTKCVAGMSFSNILNIIRFQLNIIQFILLLNIQPVIIATLCCVNRTLQLNYIWNSFFITFNTNHIKCVNSLLEYVLYYIVLLTQTVCFTILMFQCHIKKML